MNRRSLLKAVSGAIAAFVGRGLIGKAAAPENPLNEAWAERNRLRARALKMLEDANEMWKKGELNQFLERRKRELGRPLSAEEWDRELPAFSQHCKATWTPAKAAAEKEHNRLTYGGVEYFRQSEKVWTDALGLYRKGVTYEFVYLKPSEDDRLPWLSGTVHDFLRSEPACILASGEVFTPSSFRWSSTVLQKAWKSADDYVNKRGGGPFPSLRALASEIGTEIQPGESDRSFLMRFYLWHLELALKYPELGA